MILPDMLLPTSNLYWRYAIGQIDQYMDWRDPLITHFQNPLAKVDDKLKQPMLKYGLIDHDLQKKISQWINYC